MRKKPDGTWLFSLKVYKGFAGFAFCTGHKPLENKAQALLLDPLRYNDYEVYDRRLTRREIAYVNGYCKTHTEAECIDHLFMIAAYGTE